MNAVRPVILGLLAQCPGSTGYEIKRAVDSSTRFFWAASYGQIYPELRELEREGLVAAESDPLGARPRTRYALTPAGEQELVAWLASDPAWHELRDLGLLKLFFSDAVGPEATVTALRRLREDREATLRRLLAIKERGATGSAALALEYGIGLYTCIVEWCRREEASLSGADPGRTTVTEVQA